MLGRLVKCFYWLVGITVVVFLAFLIFLPTIVSTDIGRQAVVDAINSGINGEISIKKIYVGWFGHQLIEGIELDDAAGRKILSVDALTSNQGLLSGLLTSHGWDQATVNNLFAEIFHNDIGVNNIEGALAPIGKHGRLTVEPANDPVSVSGVDMTVSRDEKSGLQVIKVNGETAYRGKTGSFSLDGHLAPEMEDVYLDGHATQFPVALFDQLLTMKGLPGQGWAQLLVGETVDIIVKDIHSSDRDVINLDIKSDKLNVAMTGAVETHQFVLLKPVDITIKVTPEAFDRLAWAAPTLEGMSIGQPTDVIISISELQLPFDRRDVQKMAVGLSLSLSPTALVAVPHLGNLDISELRVALRGPAGISTMELTALAKGIHQGTPLEAEIQAQIEKPVDGRELLESLKDNAKFTVKASHFPVSLLQPMERGTVPLRLLIGEFIDLNLDGSLDKGIGSMALSVSSDNLKAEGVAFLIDDRMTLKQPTQIDYKLSADVINQSFLNDSFLRVDQGFSFRINVENLSVDLNSLFTSDNIFSAATLQASAQLVQESALHFPYDLGTLQFDHCRLSVEGTPFSEATCSMELRFAGVGESTLFQEVIGDKGELSLEGRLHLVSRDQTEINQMRLYAKSDKGSLEARADLVDGMIALLSPAELHFQLTPAAFDKMGLLNNRFITLAHNSSLSFTLAPLLNTHKNGIAALDLSGQITADRLSFHVKDDNSIISINELVIPWEINGSSDKIQLNLSGTTAYGQQQEGGAFRGKMVVTEWIHGGMPNFDEARFKGKANVSGFPTQLLSVISGYQLLVPFVGKEINLDLDAEVARSDYSGHFDLSLMSDRLDASLEMKEMPGKLTARATGDHVTAEMRGYVSEGVLTLSDPAIARVTASPELGRYILQDIVPILGSLQSSEQPITFTIPSEGTRIPLFHYDIKELAIPHIIVEMGKMSFRNEGQLAVLMSLLGKSMSPQIAVWVTPLYLHLMEGVLHVERVDFLVDNLYPFAAWGNVNFVSDQVNMVIGMR